MISGRESFPPTISRLSPRKSETGCCLWAAIDSVIDRADATEEEIRRETRRACDAYGNLKGFWPGMTYGGPGTIYPQVEEIIIDEINRYNTEHYGAAIF